MFCELLTEANFWSIDHVSKIKGALNRLCVSYSLIDASQIFAN